MAGNNGKKRTNRNIKKRDRIWPDLERHMLWSWKEHDGFVNIPRTIPYFLKIMDDLSKNKPVSSTYLSLWCRNWDESCFIKIDNPTILAKESGFGGQRAVSTWRSRMKILENLEFIKTKPLADETYGYVLLLSPYYIAKKLYDKKKYTDEGWFNALWERHDDIGASDLDDLDSK